MYSMIAHFIYFSSQSSDSTKSNYQRYPKPPYSYLGMIIMAIQMSPDKALTLSEINQSITDMFPFFRGSYKGWKDSIRHTLSSSPCLQKGPRGRTAKWIVNLTLAPESALRRQETAVSRSTYWPETICEYLGIPEIAITSPKIHRSMPVLKPVNTDFSIDRILTTEIVDDTRPLPSLKSPPAFNKLSLKMKKRQKTSEVRQEMSPLYRLVKDSASKWGVSEETAVQQLTVLCQIMDTSSALSKHKDLSSTVCRSFSQVNPVGFTDSQVTPTSASTSTYSQWNQQHAQSIINQTSVSVQHHQYSQHPNLQQQQQLNQYVQSYFPSQLSTYQTAYVMQQQQMYQYQLLQQHQAQWSGGHYGYQQTAYLPCQDNAAPIDLSRQ